MSWFTESKPEICGAGLVVDFITVLASTDRSRMYPHYGLASIRQVRQTMAYLCQIKRFPVPKVSDLASLAMQQALLDETFRPTLSPLTAGTSFSTHVRRLLEEAEIDVTETPLTKGLNFTLKKVYYRDHFLHRFCKALCRVSTRQADFLSFLDSAIDTLRNPALRQLLGDLRNEIISLGVRLKNSRDAYRTELEWLDVYPIARERARLLVRNYDFALWPTLSASIQPSEVNLTRDYEEAVMAVSKSLRKELRNRIKLIEEQGRDLLSRPHILWNTPRGYIFVSSSLTTDDYDELWQNEDEAAVLLMLERKLA